MHELTLPGAAIVGCGSVASGHLAALRLAGVPVRALCDVDEQRARRLDPSLPWTADFDAVLSDPGIALVHLCLPHHRHVDAAIAALAAGKHVLQEKPLATTPAGISALVVAETAAAARGQRVAVAFQHRHAPLYRVLSRQIAAGAWGAVQGVSVHFRCLRSPGYYAQAPWRGTWWGEGGGLLINQAIHHLDVGLVLAGQPVSVTAQLERRHLADPVVIEDHARGRIVCAGGTALDFDCANAGDREWAGSVTVRLAAGSVTWTTDGDGTLQDCQGPQALCAELQASSGQRFQPLPGKACYGNLHTAVLMDLLAAIRTGGRPLCGIAEAAPTCHAVLAAYHAAASSGSSPCPVLEPYRQPELCTTVQG